MDIRGKSVLILGGWMGLNIPYTHSEEKPSRVLLSKSALAGAHTLLLFLMARTPGGPITKEIKPAAAIAWKRLGYGEVLRGGRPVPLYDIDPARVQPVAPGSVFRPHDAAAGTATGETLKSVFIDTGENGIFSLEEFSATASSGARKRRSSPARSWAGSSPPRRRARG